MAADADPRLPFVPAQIRRTAAEPLYAQVARDLARHVRDGAPAAGERLPAEPVLARAYGVNRLTVREAIGSLARQGLVRRVQGVGSFVADAPVRHRIDAGEASLADALRRPGGPFPAFPGPVTILWVRRFADDVPWSLSLTWLPAALVGQDGHPGPAESLSAVLARRHGLRMTPAARVVGSSPAAPSDSEHLDVATGTPLVVLSGADVDQHGRRIAQVAHRIRGDRAEIGIEFRSPA
jgi:GntR family transcriptional regulator, phosphonate transport system regulatory protein